MSARDELATVIETAYDLNPGMATFELLAHATLADGYRKPTLIQYVVVTQDGGVYDCSFGQDRERAQSVADSATADARSVGLDYTYRVAELVEAAA